MEQGNALMLVRLGLQAGAGALVARGIGDAALWEAVIGGAISLGGAVWSWRVRRQLQDAAAKAGNVAGVLDRAGIGRQ